MSKLLLLHGPALASSRAKLAEVKAKFDPESVFYFEKGSSGLDILGSLQTGSLFGGEQLVIIENLVNDLDFNSLKNNPVLTIILWFDKEIDIKKFPDFQVLFFPEAKESSIFPLLDGLGQKNKKVFSEIKKIEEEFGTQYVITMIFYLLRSLLVTPKLAKDFVKAKNARMRANFSEGELVSLYKKTLEIDFKIKSGLIEETQANYLLISNFLS